MTLEDENEDIQEQEWDDFWDDDLPIETDEKARLLEKWVKVKEEAIEEARVQELLRREEDRLRREKYQFIGRKERDIPEWVVHVEWNGESGEEYKLNI